MRTSPPGSEAGGSMASIYGLPSTFFLPSRLSVFPWRCGLTRYKVQPYLKQGKRVKPSANVIHHDSSPSRQRFQASQRERLHYVKATKEYKTRQHVFPMQRHGDQSDHLAGNFVDHDKSWVFDAAFARHHGGWRNADHGDEGGNDQRRDSKPSRREPVGGAPPEQNRNDSCPRPGARLQVTNAEESGYEPGNT